MSKIHLDRTLKGLTRQPKGLDRTAAAAVLVPLSSTAVLQGAVAAINIKKHMLAERSLRDSETRYRRLFETAQDGILILDAKTGSITDVNPFLIELLEYSRAEFLGMALWDIGLFKDVEASKDAFRELQSKRYIRYEDLPLKTRSGRCINVEFVSNVYGVNSTKVIQCNIRDITQRKEDEQLDQRLRQGQKMEAVGQLAGGVAHDFNNLLGVILGHCEILEEQPDLTQPSRKMVEEIHSAGTSAKNLTQRLLAFSRRQVLQPVFLSLNESVARMDTMLGRLIGDHIELESVLRDDLGTIKADPSQLEQVLMNLAINARDAMPKGGKITIAGEREAGSVTVVFRDNGMGISERDLPPIWDRLYRGDKSRHEHGLGLGLSLVKAIVEAHEGRVEVHSIPHEGSEFRVVLPVR